MSSGISKHFGEKLDTRFSAPILEQDDRYCRRPRTLTPPAHDVPAPEVQHSSLRPSIASSRDVAGTPDTADRNSSTANAKGFENGVEDENEMDIVSSITCAGSRRVIDDAGHPINISRHRPSRNTSSSRSSFSVNSVEAFAEPRRRGHANTNDSRAPFPSFRARAISELQPRGSTLGQILGPLIGTHRTDSNVNERLSFVDDEAGKTPKIDFEELEKYVALCIAVKMSEVDTRAQFESGYSEGSPYVLEDIKPVQGSAAAPNVALKGQSFEKPLANRSNNITTVERQSIFDGSSLNRFTFFSSRIRKPIHVPRLGGLTSGDTSFRDLFKVGVDGGVWWLDVQNPTRTELEVITKAFKVHRLTREDIEMQEPREKVELFTHYYFVCFRSFNMNKHSDGFLDPIHVYIIVSADGVISFSYIANPHAENVRRRINKLGDFVSLSPDYICYAMIDDIVDCFAPIIRAAEQESEIIEDQVLIARDDDLSTLLERIVTCRKRVLNMMRLLGGKADVIKGFAKRCNERYGRTPRGNIELYLSDIQDHVVTIMSSLSHVEQMLSRSHANYLAQLNVDSILKGNGVVDSLTKITVVATVLVPLHLITGLFGMNVHVPGEGVGGYGWFFGIFGFIALVFTIVLAVCRQLRLV